jgi:hypothetical protein
MNNLGPEQLQILVWAGLLHKFPRLTLAEAEAIIDEYTEEHGLEDLVNVVMRGIQEASVFGRSDKGETPATVEPQAELPTSTS